MPRNVIIIVVLGIMLAGCRAGPAWSSWRFEGPPDMETRDYPPLYVEGWVHGCESGTSAAANHWYKFQYKFIQDWKKAQNKVYYKGWKDSFDYCQLYINQYDARTFL